MNDLRVQLQADFGEEATFDRIHLLHLGCFGTQVSATLAPALTQADTLERAWRLIQDLASWLLSRAERFPENERFMVIVGWSARVRAAQGQIFKAGGSASDLRLLVACPKFQEYEFRAGCSALLRNWQKDVFGVV